MIDFFLTLIADQKRRATASAASESDGRWSWSRERGQGKGKIFDLHNVVKKRSKLPIAKQRSQGKGEIFVEMIHISLLSHCFKENK